MVINTKKHIRVGIEEMGNIILIIARLYAKVEQVINELAQNQIDAKATKSIIIVNLKSRRISTSDNGKGASIPEMEERISKIGSRLKDIGDSGEKGLGNLSPIGIAHKYSMVTHKKGTTDPFFKISMNRDMVEGKKDVDFECETLPKGFKFREKGWTTGVSVANIEKTALRDLIRMQNPLEYICDTIAAAYGKKIEKSGIQITVRVKDIQGNESEKVVVPQKFQGRRESIDITTKYGPITFEMYLTNTKQKKPQILIDHQGRFSFPFRNMSDLWSLLSKELGTGYMQGIIHVGFCTLSADRTSFVFDDEYDKLSDAVIEFTEKYAVPWLNRLKKMKGHDLFEQIGRNVLSAADEMLKDHPELLNEIFKASVSDGHSDTDDMEHEATKIRTRKKRKPHDVPPLLEPEEVKIVTPKKKRKKKEKRLLHTGVSSDTGTKRNALKGQSGLQLLDKEGGNVGPRAWIGTEGEEKGKIVMNISHQDYCEAEYQGKAALNTYMTLIIMRILSTPFIPDNRKKIFEEEFEGVFMQYRKMITPLIPRRK